MRGDKTYIRIFKTNAPISNSKETFKMLTRHALKIESESTGRVLIADMGDGNKIIWRSVSSSNFPATIELHFSEIWSKARIVKYSRK